MAKDDPKQQRSTEPPKEIRKEMRTLEESWSGVEMQKLSVNEKRLMIMRKQMAVRLAATYRASLSAAAPGAPAFAAYQDLPSVTAALIRRQ